LIRLIWSGLIGYCWIGCGPPRMRRLLILRHGEAG
jgi:hypothetical protein